MAQEEKSREDGGYQEGSPYRYVPLAIIIFLGFSLVSSSFFGNTFYAKHPSYFLAGDAYWNLIYVEHIVRSGNYNVEPKETVAFTDEKLPAAESPLVFYYSAFLADLLGIPSYVAVQFGLMLMLLAAFSAVYLLFARYDFRLAAVISPFFLLSLNHPFIAGITWGLWKAYLSFFVFFFSLILFPARFRGGCLFLWAIFLSAIILSHPAIMPYVIIVLLLSVALSPEDRSISGFQRAVYVLLASGAVSSLYLFNHFASGRGGAQGTLAYRILQQLGYGNYDLGNATPFTQHFGTVWPLAFLGVLLAGYLLLKLWGRKNYLFRLLMLFSFLFWVFFMPLLGFERVYQFRLAWPVVVSVFAGIPFYVLLRSVQSFRNRALPFMVAFLLLLVALFSFKVLAPPVGSYSVFSDETWDAYKLISEKTPEKARILVIDPMMTQDAIVFYTKRYTRFLDYTSFNEMAGGNSTIAGMGKNIFCVIAETAKRNNITRTACEKRDMRPCEFDYIMVNLQPKSEREVGLLNDFFSSLDSRKYRQLLRGQQTIILENREVCRDER